MIYEALVSNDQTHLYAVAKREILNRGGAAIISNEALVSNDQTHLSQWRSVKF